jgi:hypothetical protein
LPLGPLHTSVGMQAMQTVPAVSQQHVRPSWMADAVRHEFGGSGHAWPVSHGVPGGSGGERSTPPLHDGPPLELVVAALVAVGPDARGTHC